MESNSLSREEIVDMLAQLEQAKQNHLQWHRELCQFFIKKIRVYDKIFRFGGEKLLICMLQTDVNACFNRSEELRKGLAALKIPFSDKEEVNMTSSFGITLFDKQFSLESNIEHVDQAMYNAKNSGRNNTKICQPS